MFSMEVVGIEWAMVLSVMGHRATGPRLCLDVI